MFNKKILLLVGGYIAGSIVNSLYNEKKGSQLQKEIKASKKAGDDSCKAIGDTFIETHKNFLDSFKSKVFTEENKNFFNKKKQDIQDIASEFKVEGEKVVKDLKGKGKSYLSDAKIKAQKLYNSKKDDLEKVKDESPEKIEEMKDKLKEGFESLKSKVK